MHLPSFVIIGSSKCGSTSIHNYFMPHPEVFMSTPKELNFFVDEDAGGNWSKGLSWYEAHFAGATEKVLGESTPGYTDEFLAEGAAARMGQTIPNAKLAYIIRNPFERVRSHYLEYVLKRRKRLPPLNNLLIAGSRDVSSALGEIYRDIVFSSLFGRQLQRYLKHFPAERVYVLRLQDLRDRPKDTMRGLLQHLEVDHDYELPDVAKHHNDTRSQLDRARWINPTAMISRLPLYSSLTSIVPESAKQRFRNFVSISADRIERMARVGPEGTDILENLFAEDAELFRSLMGVELSA